MANVVGVAGFVLGRDFIERVRALRIRVDDCERLGIDAPLMRSGH